MDSVVFQLSTNPLNDIAKPKFLVHLKALCLLINQAFYQYVHGAVRYSYVLVRAVQYQPQAGTRWCSTAAVVVPVQPVPKQY